MTRGEFYEAACAYAQMMGGSQTSGIRSTQRNAAVGGKVYSPHRFGFGLDIVYDDPTMLRFDHPLFPNAVRIETASRLGLKLIPEGDHDHLQPLDWKAG